MNIFNDFDEVLKVRRCGRTKLCTIPKNSDIQVGDKLVIMAIKKNKKYKKK